MTANPVITSLSLLKAQDPDVYRREMIYDPTWNDPAYAAYGDQKIIPAVGSLVKDTDNTPLWVTAVDPVTFVPTYEAVPLSTENDNVVSLLNWGNSVFRLYVDYRAEPYPATPDPKCLFIGKSPRFYTLTRFPNTAQATIISKYYDSTGTLVSQQIPLAPTTIDDNSWTLPRGNIADQLDDNEEVQVTIYDESGAEVYSAILFAKQSAVINENVIYAPTIVDMAVTGNQQLIDGTFYLFEKQDFGSLGLTANLVYDDGTAAKVPIDGVKCILYGQSDFISSFAGLQQTLYLKYYRSSNEAINSTLTDPTGSMITKAVPVTVVSNTLGVSNKIVALPSYSTSNARYVMRYWMYFADGRSAVDVTGYVTSTTLVTDASYFGVQQTTTLSVDMNKVDPTHYAVSTTYQQTLVITFNPPTTLVRWTFQDSATAPNTYGLDNSTSRRPQLKYDSTRKQYFVPSYIFGNAQAVIQSFYTKATPPFDPNVALTPTDPTHFVIRDITSQVMLTASPIPLASYAQAVNFVGDTTGAYSAATVVVEFIAITSNNVTTVLYGVPVTVSVGTYAGN